MRQLVCALVVIFLFTMYISGCTYKNNETSDELQMESLRVLREVLHHQNEWVKVHAAEFLLWTGYPEEVKEIYLSEEKIYGEKPQYRIGIWRVLAQTADSDVEKKICTDKILAAFLDENGNDRIHAAETLAKLGLSPLEDNQAITRNAINSPDKRLSLYTLWSVAHSSQAMRDSVKKKMIEIVTSAGEDPAVKNQASFIIRQLGGLSGAEWENLANAVGRVENQKNIYLLGALFIYAPESAKVTPLYQNIYQQLVSFKTSESKGERYEMAFALAQNGNQEDLSVLESLLHAEYPLLSETDNEDVKAAAAYGILMIKKRIH